MVDYIFVRRKISIDCAENRCLIISFRFVADDPRQSHFFQNG